MSMSELTHFTFLFTGAFITEISVTAPYLDTYIVKSEHYLPQPEVEEEVDLAKELELLEQEMEQIRLKQTWDCEIQTIFS